MRISGFDNSVSIENFPSDVRETLSELDICLDCDILEPDPRRKPSELRAEYDPKQDIVSFRTYNCGFLLTVHERLDHSKFSFSATSERLAYRENTTQRQVFIYNQKGI